MATIATSEAALVSSSANGFSREFVFDAFRRWGYLQAQLDPLEQHFIPQPIRDLDLSGPDADEARGYYCGTIAAEFMHIPDPARRAWIQDRIETRDRGNVSLKVENQRHTLDLLLRADLFEQVIQSRYLGTKRFSLEGVTVLVPFLDELLNQAAEHGAAARIWTAGELARAGSAIRAAARAMSVSYGRDWAGTVIIRR